MSLDGNLLMSLVSGGVLIIGTLLLWRVWRRFGSGMHAVQQRSAEKVLGTLQSFTGDRALARTLSYLRKINPFVYEELLLSAFERCGFEVIRNKRYTGDGGIDGHVIYRGEPLPLQAKRYNRCIKRTHVHQFSIITRWHNRPFGLFCHTGRTGPKAFQAALEGENIVIISGERLLRLIQGDSAYVSGLLDKGWEHCVKEKGKIPT